jgi:hypothetical protein
MGARVNRDTPGKAQGGKGDENRLIVALRHWWSGRRRDEPHVVLDDTRAVEPIEDEGVKAAAVGAALAHVLSRPDSIRQRAQNAATISSAVAAALVIAGLSQLAGGKLSVDRPGGIALLIAVVLWVVSVGMSVYAVTFIDKGGTPNRGFQPLVDSYEEYAVKIRAKTRVAATFAGFALVATAAAMFIEMLELKSPPDQKMQILLTDDGAVGVRAICSRESSDSIRLEGLVATTDLRRPLVHIKDVKLVPKAAGKKPQAPAKCVVDGVDVEVPRSAIRAVRNTDP